MHQLLRVVRLDVVRLSVLNRHRVVRRSCQQERLRVERSRVLDGQACPRMQDDLMVHGQHGARKEDGHHHHDC